MPRFLSIHEGTGPDRLQLDDLPEPKNDEVRIRVEAFTLNYGDFGLMDNDYPFLLEFPATFGDEMCGIVDAIGPGVTLFKLGERIGSLPWMNAGYGVNGEYALVPEYYLAPCPENLTSNEGASIWVQYLTAYFPPVEIGELGADSSVLIIAATGSTGLGALQLAQCLGVRSICTTRFDSNRRYLEEARADFVIATETEDLNLRLQEIGGGVDLVYDPVGGKIISAYADALARDAKVVIYGGISCEPTILPELQLTKTNATVHLYSGMNYMENSEYRDRGISFIHDHLDRGQLKPVVDRTFPFTDFSAVFAHMNNTRQQHGKVVIRTDQSSE